jgi:hypothetical protein
VHRHADRPAHPVPNERRVSFPSRSILMEMVCVIKNLADFRVLAKALLRFERMLADIVETMLSFEFTIISYCQLISNLTNRFEFERLQYLNFLCYVLILQSCLY